MVDGLVNSRQFANLASKILLLPSLASDPKFSTNPARVQNRDELVKIITGVLMGRSKEQWMEVFKGKGCVHSLSLSNFLF